MEAEIVPSNEMGFLPPLPGVPPLPDNIAGTTGFSSFSPAHTSQLATYDALRCPLDGAAGRDSAAPGVSGLIGSSVPMSLREGGDLIGGSESRRRLGR